MPRERVRTEREDRVAAKIARQEKTVNWLSTIPHLKISQLVAIELREEDVAADRKMAEIAVEDAANAARLGFDTSKSWDEFLHSPDASRVRQKLLNDERHALRNFC